MLPRWYLSYALFSTFLYCGPRWLNALVFPLVRIGAALGPHWRIALTLLQHYTIPTCALLILLVVLYFAGMYAIKRYLRSHNHEALSDTEAEEQSCDPNLLEV